ncbi:MAG: hypothetical protein SGI72_16580 [Planctomycetota bacterium]|nr:hypothetical protein [Planctomycetota bacterium]
MQRFDVDGAHPRVGRFSIRHDAENLLRARGRFSVDASSVPWIRIARLVLAAGIVYGATMGSLGWSAAGIAYSAIKLPILLVFALCICLPSFYVVHAILGLRDDFSAAVRGIVSAQGTVAIALCALAPVTAFVYSNRVAYSTALFWNGVAFVLAMSCGQATLARHYRALIARDRRHRFTLIAWFALYAFVSIKVGWVLRPFVGDPTLPIEFLREGKWAENPYSNLFWTTVAIAIKVGNGV